MHMKICFWENDKIFSTSNIDPFLEFEASMETYV